MDDWSIDLSLIHRSMAWFIDGLIYLFIYRFIGRFVGWLLGLFQHHPSLHGAHHPLTPDQQTLALVSSCSWTERVLSGKTWTESAMLSPTNSPRTWAASSPANCSDRRCHLQNNIEFIDSPATRSNLPCPRALTTIFWGGACYCRVASHSPLPSLTLSSP